MLRAVLGHLRNRGKTPSGPLLPGVEPVSRRFGSDRGKPVDRWYIERFLASQRADVRGAVLEIAETTYTDWYGDGQVTSKDVMHITGCEGATIVGDLQTLEGVPREKFDCFICTQTFQVIPDVVAGVQGAHDVLKPGGVLLATLPAMSHNSAQDAAEWGDWNRFTSWGARRLFESVFDDVTVRSHGNVRTCAAFLYGYAAEELEVAELELDDPEYELMVTVRAVRAA